MRKIVLNLTSSFAILTYLISPVSFADSVFGFGSSKTPASTTNTKQSGIPKVSTTPVMSSSDFKSKVTTMGQTTKSNVTQQVKQSFTKQPPPPPNVAPPSADESQSTTTGTSTSTGAPTSPTRALSAPPATTMPPKPATSGFGSTSAPAPAAPAKDNYTGFGTGNTTTQGVGTTPANSNSGGWNIKY